MITYAIQDWYRDDNDELVADDTGYIVEWHTDRDKLTCGTYGMIYAAPDGDILTTVSYCNNAWTPYYNFYDGKSYDSLAYLVERTLANLYGPASRDGYYLSQKD